MKPVLAGSMEFPLAVINVKKVVKDLTIDYMPMGAEAPFTVHAYRATKETINVPRQYGIELCQSLGLEYEDNTSKGKKAHFPRIPKPRDYQVQPLEELSECFDSYYDFIFRARTGWGKTVGALYAAARLGRTTLVIVDQENLKDQWIASLKEHFGFTDSNIGIIQGQRCDYEGKAVTIAMVQTLSRKKFPEAVYRYFGTVIVDEVHIIGAPTFYVVLLAFAAMYRFGVSATPRRRDTLQKLLTYNLGEVRLFIEDEHDASAVYVATHDSVYSAYANKSPKIGRFINEVAEDASRNLMLAEAAMYLYDTGRDILVLSDRIEHLRHLESLCYYLGAEDNEIGVYSKSNVSYAYAKDPSPLRRPEGYVRGAEYTPIKLSLISKTTKKTVLETIKTKARIVNATYGKFSKGVDEPRLSGGVDATPRSQSEQMQGRILRKKDGKKKPIWVTTADKFSYRSLYSLLARLPDYVKNNSVVSKWSLEKGKESCDVRTLKMQLTNEIRRLKVFTQIVTNSDGLSTLQTREQQRQPAAPPAKGITVVNARRRVLLTGSSRGARTGK
jgi:superfamily II DNA or RNA helicase